MLYLLWINYGYEAFSYTPYMFCLYLVDLFYHSFFWFYIFNPSFAAPTLSANPFGWGVKLYQMQEPK